MATLAIKYLDSRQILRQIPGTCCLVEYGSYTVSFWFEYQDEQECLRKVYAWELRVIIYIVFNLQSIMRDLKLNTWIQYNKYMDLKSHM